jgi:ABC-type lipoprotein export system ATPase subunit
LYFNYKKVLLIGKSGSGKTSLLKTATTAIAELGHFINMQSVFINSYTNEELFGDATNTKTK